MYCNFDLVLIASKLESLTLYQVMNITNTLKHIFNTDYYNSTKGLKKIVFNTKYFEKLPFV
jgi:hypothetical protein